MAGHSKWANIKHRKAAQDAKKGKILTKHSKILMVTAKSDPNPDTNASLRAAISNAKADGVPKDNIERILKKLSGEGKDAAVYSEQVYEGYGPEGVPFVILAMTDNINRTFPAVRTAFNKNGGNLGSSGAVSYMFDHVGIVIIQNDGKSEDALFEAIMEAGADDFTYEIEDGKSEVVTAFSSLAAVRDALTDAKITVLKSEPQYRAKSPVQITDEKVAEKIMNFVDKLEDVEDVDDVFGGFEIQI